MIYFSSVTSRTALCGRFGGGLLHLLLRHALGDGLHHELDATLLVIHGFPADSPGTLRVSMQLTSTPDCHTHQVPREMSTKVPTAQLEATNASAGFHAAPPCTSMFGGRAGGGVGGPTQPANAGERGGDAGEIGLSQPGAGGGRPLVAAKNAGGNG